MKDFSSWGIKIRRFPEYEYQAIWNNLKTLRVGFEKPKQLPADCSEFYDIAIGTKCNLNCPFCYANSSKNGRFFTNITDKAKLFFDSMDVNQKPFQVAIGSSGEPTIHPEFSELLEILFNMGIVPNYTTNGITIADNSISGLLEATEKYCGGVAVSVNDFNDEIHDKCRHALDILMSLDIHVNVHVIISDSDSVIKLNRLYEDYGNKIHTYVLLPMMRHGRSTTAVTPKAFEHLQLFLSMINKSDRERFAFGANFYQYLINQKDDERKITCSLYEPESFSKNLILDDVVKITPSSFNTNTILYKRKYENGILV